MYVKIIFVIIIVIVVFVMILGIYILFCLLVSFGVWDFCGVYYCCDKKLVFLIVGI